MEEWKYINGWEGVYQISSYGRVKRIYTKGYTVESLFALSLKRQ